MEVKTINTVVTSKGAILAACRDLAKEKGLGAVNMRSVAGKCGVAVGSIYNYFPSKTQLIAAAVENVWQEIFHEKQGCTVKADFVGSVLEIFNRAQEGIKEYPDFFTMHSISFAGQEKSRGRQLMTEYFQHMKAGLLTALQEDENVKARVFTESFTENDFIDFVFSNLLSLLMQKNTQCTALMEVTKRVIY